MFEAYRFPKDYLTFWHLGARMGIRSVTRFLRRVPRDDGRVLVDIGSGGGSTSLLAARLGFRVVSVDLSSRCLLETRKAGAKLAPPRGIGCVAADCCQIPLRDASAEAVVASHIIEHLDEPQRLLAEASRILKPGGLLRVSCPSTFHALRIGRWLGLSLDPSDHKVTGYTAQEIAALLPEGLEIARRMYEGRFFESNFADLQHLLAQHFHLRANPAVGVVDHATPTRVPRRLGVLWVLKELVLLPLLLLCRMEDALLFFLPGSMISLEIRKA